MKRLGGLLLGFAIVAPAAAERVERVAIVMRHGVRPPTKAIPMPAGTARDPWPAWDVAPGFLTAHGAAAITLIGQADRAWLAASGVLPAKGCPAPAAVRTLSDSDQRTIATGEAFLAGLAPGCALPNEHRPQGEADPLFAAAGEARPLDPARADAAVRAEAGTGGIAAVEVAHRRLLDRVDAILCGGPPAPGCGVSGERSAAVAATATRRPKLAGALDRASTAAQILLLEYAEGKPMAEVGWGRATAADLAALGRFHATEFALVARPPYLAARNIAPIAGQLLAALDPARPAARVTLIVGHDTNVASLGGLLGLHWQAPGFAADDPPPGGALVFELVENRGQRFVRASFRAQRLDDIRTLAKGAVRQPLVIEACPGRCDTAAFRTAVLRLLAAAD